MLFDAKVWRGPKSDKAISTLGEENKPHHCSQSSESTELGHTTSKRPKKPLWSAKNIEDRVKYGNFLEQNGYLTVGLRGREILFTDETWMYIHPVGNPQNTRYRTDKTSEVLETKMPKKGLQVIACGGFCSRGVQELHIIWYGHSRNIPAGQNVNGQYYRGHILPVYFDAMENKELFPNKKKITFQQDGAPAHTANATMRLLEDKPFTVLGKGAWPGNSPDLNREFMVHSQK